MEGILLTYILLAIIFLLSVLIAFLIGRKTAKREHIKQVQKIEEIYNDMIKSYEVYIKAHDKANNK